MRKNIFPILVGLLAALGQATAQNVKDLIISEIVVENETGLVNDYGERCGWIELYNPSQGTVKYGGCFLSNDRDDLKKFMIPKGVASTALAPGQVAVVYASGITEQGVLYTNFTLEKGETVYLVSNDGKTVIDSLAVPSDLPVDMAIAKTAADAKQTKFVTSIVVPTPDMRNGVLNAESGAERLARNDPHGWILTVTSVAVVFSALLILWLIFGQMGKAFGRAEAKKKEAQGNAGTQKMPSKNGAAKPAKGAPDAETAAAIAMALQQELGGETHAAIAMAMHLYLSQSVHDEEPLVITISEASGSGWARKGQTFRQLPG